MGPKNLREIGAAFGAIQILLFSIVWNPKLATAVDTYLKVQALGRTANLGDLYNEYTGEFRDVNIFKKSIPRELIATSQRPDTTIHTATTSTFSDKFRLFNVDFNTAANILTEIIEVEGAATFLKDKPKNNNVLGILLYQHQTYKERLKAFSEGLKNFYNTDLLQHKQATHIVTGITWGVNVALGFKTSETTPTCQQDLTNLLESELHRWDDASLASVPDSDATLNFTVSVKSDLFLPNDDVLETHSLIKHYFYQVPQLIKNTDDSLGVPIQFTITPLSAIKASLNLPIDENIPNADSLNSLDLEEFMDVFDEIYQTEKRIYGISQQLKSQPTCIQAQTKIKMTSLSNKFAAAKSNFTSLFKVALNKMRSSTSSSFDADTVLTSLLDQYRTSEYNAQNIETKLAEFNDVLNKIKILNSLQVLHPKLEYFGRRNNLQSRIIQNSDKVIYILFHKNEFIQSDLECWQSNLNTMLQKLNQPFNSLFLVDCNFKYSQCASVNGTVIKQMINGKVTVDDVQSVIKTNELSKPRKMAAIGRQAEIGELYDAKTDSFLQRSMFKPTFQKSLIQVTQQDDLVISTVPSESYQDKLTALNIDPELQFSVMSGLFPLTRSGQYLAHHRDVQSLGNSVKSSILHTRYLNKEQVKIHDPELAEFIAVDVLKKVEATHFVSKIQFGFSSVFSVQKSSHRHHLHRSSNYSTIKNNEDSNDLTVDSKFELTAFADQLKNILDDSFSTSRPSLTKNVNEVNQNFQVKIFSDIQTEDAKPITVKGTERLLEFVNQKFLPKLDPRSSETATAAPIFYVLYPIHNLRSELGLVIPDRPYFNLSTINPALFAAALDDATNAEGQIIELRSKLTENIEIASDEDFKTVKSAQKSFANSTLGTFKMDLKNTVIKIRTGELNSNSLNTLLENYNSENYFVGGTQRYKELDKLANFEEKLKLYETIKGAKNIKYLGRKHGGLPFTAIFQEPCEEQTKIYLLYYKHSWTTKDGGKNEKWHQCSAFFFGPFSQAPSNSSKKFYVIDCDFEHYNNYCDQMTEPAVHEYKNGRLSSKNFLNATEEEENDFRKQLDEVKSSVHEIQTDIGSWRMELNTTVQQNRNELDYFVKPPSTCANYRAPFNKPLSPVVHVECGGLITIPGIASNDSTVFYVDYKSNQTYDPNERCLWTLDDTISGYKYRFYIKISLVCDGFGDSGDEVSVIENDESTSFSTNRLPTYKLSQQGLDFTSFSQPLGVFLNFNSHDNLSGKGFIIRIDIFKKIKLGTFTGSNMVFRTPTGSQSVGHRTSGDRLSIVINPQNLTRTTLTVENLDAYVRNACNYYDALLIYEIGKTNNAVNRLACLYNRVTSRSTYSTDYPILATYYTNGVTSGSSFLKFNWK